MDDFTSNELIQKIEFALKEVINDILNGSDPIDNLEQVVAQKVNNKINGLSQSLSFSFPIPDEIEVKDISYEQSMASNGVIKGEITIEHCEKRNTFKYGEPGYPGKEDGQLCEYPKHSGEFYKWNDFSCKWEYLYKDIDRSNDRQSWSDKLMNNAAFEPWWGNNTSGGNYLRSDRKRNGADDLWGDPGVRSYMGTFKQISADVMQSIYRFTLNLKSAIGHYEKIGTTLGFGDEENTSTNNDLNMTEEDLKVKITIERMINHHINIAFGMRQESSVLVRKDTLVYGKDSTKVQENIKRKNEELRKRRENEFNNKQ
ncbi:hypothetical protein [Aquimarina aggregata]|uniref:hypothetical protein n=1 Tax=Aquimarina aggregata TaxID=1642818 RepID=UPI002491B36E|nr:hypothetical protein [Aquimarina aggregata]